MFSRLLTVALLTAGTALAFSTAQAQTSGSSGSTGSITMSPSPSSPSPSTGSSSMGSSGSTTQQAQQPMSSGTFNASNFKTKAECLTAATAQHADRTLCNSLK